MAKDSLPFQNIDQYIAQYEGDVRKRLDQLCQLIRDTVPQGTSERISWDMPTFFLYGNLIHFAVSPTQRHVGLYPGASGVEHFMPKLSEYKTSKGAIQFPMNKPLPLELVREIVTFRAMENLRDEDAKQARKAAEKAAKTEKTASAKAAKAEN